MKLIHAVAALSFFLFAGSRAAGVGEDFAALRARAEALQAEGSYELAHRAWLEVDTTKLSPDEKRWVEFRAADTSWRSAAGSHNADTTAVDGARRALEEMQQKIERPEDHDRTWAEVEESLGDWHWLRREANDFSGALPHYQRALDWWAGARDVDAARDRYLAMIGRMAWPAGDERNLAYHASQIPLDLAENALRIATSDNDRAQAEFLFAMIVKSRGGDYEQMKRALEMLTSAVSSPHKTAWYDDALFYGAQWLETNGVPMLGEDGNWSCKPDFDRALALYRRLTSEFKKGDSAYYDQAREAIARILRPEIGVYVPHTFLPGSEIGYELSWRNVSRVDLALYAVDLTHAVDFQRKHGRGSERSSGDWLASIDLGVLEKLAAFTHDTKDAGDHAPGNAELHLDRKLAPGAYVLEARGGEASAREILLVTSSALVMKASGEKVLAWFHDALTSEPIGGADVKLWERSYAHGAWHWRARDAKTGDDGTVVWDLLQHESTEELFVAAAKGDRTAFALGGGAYARSREEAWKIYAFTDRSTYRPLDEVQWKVIARTSANGKYSTPAGESLEYEIADPRGASVRKGVLELNAFGAAWTSLATKTDLPLGEYRVSFFTKRGSSRTHVGSATLFRLEEYKLPEFEVKVELPEKDGAKRLYRTGDRVEVAIDAEHYFGGGVANADVEVLVYQRPYWRTWTSAREFGWYYDDQAESARANFGGPGQITTRERLKTDAEGRAKLAFETPRNSGQDFEYTIEARVIDASRREVSGRGTVRVTRQAYAVNATVAHALHRPGDKIEFTFEARDANDHAVATDGDVKVTRNRWVETWIDPAGREITGRELESLREKTPAFPPISAPGERGWKLKFRGYESEDVAAEKLRTDSDGRASFTLVAREEGYYSAAWKSRDPFGSIVEASVVAWVASRDSRELGFRSSGLDLVVDKETFRAGETAPVMIATRASNRWVLFSVESEVLHSYQVVHVEGTAKLVMLPIGEEHVPNVFLSAYSAEHGEALMDAKEIVVPPVDRFLDVQVTADRAELRPGEQGTFLVTTRDRLGHPVSAEVALALSDASVAAIQSEYAIDPREFFFGSKRALAIQTHSSFEQKRFAKYALDDKGNLREERLANAETRGAGAGGEYEGAEGDLSSTGGGVRRDLAKDEKKRDLLGRAKSLQAAERAAPASAAGALNAARESDSRSSLDAASSPEAAVEVRTDFRATALWKPDLVTDAEGRATIQVRYPDSLTRWNLSARVAAADARFGRASITTRTEKPLIARLEAPRFFVVGDELTLSGVFDNRTDEPMSVRPTLDARGLVTLSPAPERVTIAAHGEARVDWKVRASEPGAASVTLEGRSALASDGMQKSFDVHAHGIEASIARSLKLRDRELACTLDIPAERQRDTTDVTLEVSPSLAVTMLDALPYLVDYPYGCTEQTLSRFLPAAIVAKTLKDRGLSPEDAMSRVFGGIESKSAAATHPKGKHSLDELAEMERRGLERLYEFQHADGGWGWWKEGSSDRYMSAYVVWGLSLARDAGLDVRGSVVENGARYLSLAIVEEERNPDLAAWMLHALAAHSKRAADDKHVSAAFDKLWKERDALNAYTRALFALAAHGLGRREEAKVLAQNLANGVQTDSAPDASRIDPSSTTHHASAPKTAHWGADRTWHRWSDGGVEATAFALRALLAIDPENELVEPAATWLLQNRRGAQWSNTRDTAISVLALDEYLGVTGEIARDVEYELSFNDRVIAHTKLAAKDMLAAPSSFTIPRDAVVDGANAVKLVRVAGEGPLYLGARARFFSLEEPIPARGNEIFVKRQYFKLVGRPTLLKGYVYDEVPLEDGGSVKSGERVEVLLTVESKNDFEYLLFEDLKPAGLEAAQQKSGESMAFVELKTSEVEHSFGAENPARLPDPNDPARYTGRRTGVHEELRDRKVAFFVDKLSQGIWEARYELRAEVPGRFHALPTLGQAMYVPEIRCNGREQRMSVEESGTVGG
jgi:uncharacterized protein YfaS (alpha-2-macroglobulin family)